jgi:hypothetical protein
MFNEPVAITTFPTSIFGIAGYYTDYDRMQHVIAAAKNGDVYQVIWDPSELAPGYPPVERFGHFDNMVTIAGFFTPDDNNYHSVVITRAINTANDYKLQEIWYKLAELPRTNTSVLPYQISNNFDPYKGMAGFYSSCDDLRHLVIVDSHGNPVDITWNSQSSPNGKTIIIPPTIDQVASISSFLSRDENPNTRHIIVARKDTGEIYDIDYSYKKPVPPPVGQNNVRTSFGELVKNVTAFFGSDTNDRHIVVLTKQNWLKDHAYSTYGANRPPIQLVQNDNIVDITSFYSARDQLCHVLYVTIDGNLHEITYTSQG